MNRNSLWIVMLIAASWIGFLLGYAVSSHTGGKSAVAAKAPAAGGYGQPSGAQMKAPAAAGYGQPSGVAAKKSAAGAYGQPVDKGSGKRGEGERTGAPPR